MSGCQVRANTMPSDTPPVHSFRIFAGSGSCATSHSSTTAPDYDLSTVILDLDEHTSLAGARLD